MTDPLLDVKFHIPHLTGHHISRPQLLARLEAGLQQRRKLTLVSAPAGYGKSSLASDWIDHCSKNPAQAAQFTWLSLDENDNDPNHFIRYLIGALRVVRPNIGQETSAYLGLPGLLPAENLLNPLLNELNRLETPIVLILDDYHRITAEPVHNLMRYLLDFLPVNFHLMILTREDPPLPVARMRARGQITEIRTTHLRFRPDETTSFFKKQGLDLKPEWLALLETRTEGWPTGLFLTYLSLETCQDMDAFFSDLGGSHRYAIDYLMDEVFNHLPGQLRQFLLDTSILPQICLPLCEAVTNCHEAYAYLEQIQKSNLFLIALDEQRFWFRYHHLFANSLLARLEQTDPQRIPGLHRQAALWFDPNGFPTLAIQHATSAGDSGLVLEIIRHWIDRKEQEGAFAELAGWFRQVPDPALQDDLGLLYHKLRALYRSGDYQGSEQTRKFLEKRLDHHNESGQAEPFRGLKVRVLFEKAVFASMQGDLDLADRLLQDAGQLARPDDSHEQLQYHFYRGVNAASRGDFDSALDAYQICFRLNCAEEFTWNAANCLANMLEVYHVQGKLQYGIQAGEDFKERYRKELSSRGYLEGLNHALGILYYQTNQLDLAENVLRQTYQSSLLTQNDDNFGGWRLWLALVANARGKVSEAEDLIQKSEPWVQGFPGEQFKVYAGAIRSRIRLMQDRLDEPIAWSRRFEAERNQPYFKEFQNMTLAWLWIRQNKAQDALTLLASRLPEIEAQGAGSYVIENLALKALALARLKRQPESLECLRVAMDLALPERQERIFIDFGEEMAVLLSKVQADLSENDPRLAMVRRLLASRASPSQTLGQPPAAEPLTEREIEILTMIAGGMSNSEIAARLFLSIHTVKWYTYQLYSKLGVKNRTQAVLKARQLSLL